MSCCLGWSDASDAISEFTRDLSNLRSDRQPSFEFDCKASLENL